MFPIAAIPIGAPKTNHGTQFDRRSGDRTEPLPGFRPDSVTLGSPRELLLPEQGQRGRRGLQAQGRGALRGAQPRPGAPVPDPPPLPPSRIVSLGGFEQVSVAEV